MSTVPILGYFAEWPIWVQALVSLGVAIVWLSFLTWLINLFKRPSKPSEGDMNMDRSQGGAQFRSHDIRDSKIEIHTSTVPEPAKPSLIAISVRCEVIPDNKVLLFIKNESKERYEFNAKMHHIYHNGEPLMADKVPYDIKWESSDNAFLPISPKSEGVLEVARGGGRDSREKTRTLYMCRAGDTAKTHDRRRNIQIQ